MKKPTKKTKLGRPAKDRNIDKAVGKRIANWRTGKMEREELAAIIGVSEGQMRRYENGSTSTNAVLLVKIAAALGIKAANFIDGIEV